MSGANPAVVVQANVDDFLQDIQASSSLTASKKRKKALAKFSQWYLNLDAPPQLNASQVEQVLVGDALRVDAGRSKSSKRTGLVHLSGFLKRRKEQGVQLLTQSAILAIDLLDRIVNIYPTHPSGPLFRETFASLPVKLLQKIRFDRHAVQQTRLQAFRLVQCVLKYQRQRQREGGNRMSTPIVLETLLQDDDAHDMYIEWEDEFDEDEEEEEPAEKKDPGTWNKVNLTIENEEEDHYEDDDNPTKTLLASVLQNTMQEQAAAAAAAATSAEPDARFSLNAQDLAMENEASQKLSESFKSLGTDSARVEDPLRIRAGDIRSYEMNLSQAPVASGTALAFQKQAAAAAASTRHLGMNSSTIPPIDEDAIFDNSDTESVASSSMMDSPGAPSMKKKKSRFRNILRGQVSRKNAEAYAAGPDGASYADDDSVYTANTLTKSVHSKTFRTFRRKPKKEGLSQLSSMPNLSYAGETTMDATANSIEPEISQEDRDHFLDRQVLAQIYEYAKQNPPRPESGSFRSSLPSAHTSFASNRSPLASGTGQNDKLSLMPNADNFNPSLYLWRVHRNTELGDLVLGLRNLEKDNEDQTRAMKNLVRENFDEFVHCRSTIGQIDSLMRQHAVTAPSASDSPMQSNSGRMQHSSSSTIIANNNAASSSSSSSSTANGPGRTAKVDSILEQALGTAEENFSPLLAKRKRIRKLRRAADMLQRLEYLWQLPQRLRDLMARHKWIVAVIEFSNVGQLLAVLNRNKSSVGEHRTFYHDAVRDLEACGIDLVNALKSKLTAKDGGAAQAALTGDDKDGGDAGTLTEDTDLALRKDQIDSLLCTEALSLLLELRDHVPQQSRLYRMLDEDNDPFLVLAVSQQTHGAAALKAINANEHGALRQAGKIARAYLGIWEDARVCLDPSSASSGKEHIFDVLNRVKGEAGAIVSSRGSGGLQVAQDPSAEMDADTEVMDELARLRNARSGTRGGAAGASSSPGDDDRDGRHRAGSTDLLFDIRKRSAANCTLEDLAERRKSSDEMAWSIVSAYMDVGRRVAEARFAKGDLAVVRKSLQSLLESSRSMRARGAFNAAAHAAKRLERKHAGDQSRLDFIAQSEPFALLERLAAKYARRKLEMQLSTTKQDIVKDEMSSLPRVTGRHGHVPQLVVVVRAVDQLHAVLADIETLVRSTDGLSFWSNAFLDECVSDVSTKFSDLLDNICAWTERRSKGASAEIIALLFADCFFLRDTFVDRMEQLLAEAIQPEIRTHQNEREPFVTKQHEKLQKLEDKLMAQYVQQNGHGLKSLVNESVMVPMRIDWQYPPVMVRQYTMDVLSHLVHVVAECSFRVGELGTRRLICGLMHRLALIYSIAISAAVADGFDPSNARGFAMQLRAEISFLRTVLVSFETRKASDAFASALSFLHTEKPVPESNETETLIALVQDAAHRAALIIRALGIDPDFSASNVIMENDRPEQSATPPPTI